MNLYAALTQAANQLQLSQADLFGYPVQDPHGGYASTHDDGFPVGSTWRVEGQFLYSLVRALRPARVLEIGTWHGCGATHILQALHDTGGEGWMNSVDCGIEISIDSVGDMIPTELRYRWTLDKTTIEDFTMARFRAPYDFIFEDAMHSPEQVQFIWSQIPKLLKPGGVIVSHDAAHFIVGPDVREGIRRAGYDATVYAIEPADCGLAVWQSQTPVV